MRAIGGLLRVALQGMLACMPPQRAIVEIHWSSVFFFAALDSSRTLGSAVSSLLAAIRGFSTAPVNYRLDSKRKYVSSRVG